MSKMTGEKSGRGTLETKRVFLGTT